LLSKNPICVEQRKGYFTKIYKNELWAYNQLMFGFITMKFAEHIINTFRCNRLIIFIFIEGFHTEKKNKFPRTPVNNELLLIEQYHEVSRRTAAEQMGSPCRSEYQVHAQVPPNPGVTNLGSSDSGQPGFHW
jgi:hypothetical protein